MRRPVANELSLDELETAVNADELFEWALEIDSSFLPTQFSLNQKMSSVPNDQTELSRVRILGLDAHLNSIFFAVGQISEILSVN